MPMAESDTRQRTLFDVRAQDGAVQLSIIGSIYDFTFKDLRDRMAEEDVRSATNLDVVLHSPGGSVFAGFAIFAELDRHPATVSVDIRGLAASIASVIAMAAAPGRISMHKLGRIMIHQARAGVFGTEQDMQDMQVVLRDLDKAIRGAYTRHVKWDDAKLMEAMKATTWLDATAAKKAGFISNIVEGPDAAARLDLEPLAEIGVPDDVRRLYDETIAPPDTDTTTSIYSEVLLHLQNGARPKQPAPSSELLAEVRRGLDWLKEKAA